LIVTFRTN